MKKLLSALAACSLCSTAALAASAYLTAPGQLSVQPTYSHQWARDFWFNDTPFSLSGDLVQDTAGLDGQWGIAPGVALDWSVAYSTVTYEGGTVAGLELTQNGKQHRSGIADSNLGLSFNLSDEFASPSDATPTISARIGGIIAGNYDTGFLNAPGDGASGVEFGLLFGKFFPLLNGGVYGDLGYRWLSSDTPDAWLGSVGAYKILGPITLSAGLREYHSVDGLDILGPGFTLDRFTAVREINRSYEAGLTWRQSDRNSFSVGYAHTFEGENTPKKSVVVLAGNLLF